MGIRSAGIDPRPGCTHAPRPTTWQAEQAWHVLDVSGSDSRYARGWWSDSMKGGGGVLLAASLCGVRFTRGRNIREEALH